MAKIVRNLIWMLAIFAVPAAILMLVAFVKGFPLRMLVVVIILVPVMGVMVTVLTLLNGKRRTGGGSGDYSRRTYYPVGVP
jgi:type III secretory pathway component EscV